MASSVTRWSQIVGHDWAIQLLNSAINHDRVGHAYLFTGPDHVGKTAVARVFAQAVNCTAEEGERPCGKCRACELIAVDRHPDVRLVVPETNRRGNQTLKIEQIRDLQHELGLSTFEARYKVAIVRQFDTATPGASNAFLKTLEEPPGQVILLLTAVDAEQLLPTITSRCHVINLRPILSPMIEEALMTTHRANATQANLLAHAAGGRIGWAIRANEEPKLLEEREEQLAQLRDVLAANRTGRFAVAEQLARKPEALGDTLQSWLSWWRDLALLATGRHVHFSPDNIDQISLFQDAATAWKSKDVVDSLAATERALWQIKRNANTRLALENLLLIYPRAGAEMLAGN